jgi:hypothetical protein
MGGDLAAHQALVERNDREQRQRNLWQYQIDLFNRASRVSFARVVTSVEISIEQNSPGRRLEVEPVEVYKGSPVDGKLRSVADKGYDSCSIYGGGTGTGERPGRYVLLYEDVQKNGGTPHTTMLVGELRDPRILAQYGKSLEPK